MSYAKYMQGFNPDGGRAPGRRGLVVPRRGWAGWGWNRRPEAAAAAALNGARRPVVCRRGTGATPTGILSRSPRCRSRGHAPHSQPVSAAGSPQKAVTVCQ